MKKLISLFFLFFNLILSSPLVVIDAFDPTKAGCLVPEEYCSGDTITEFRCDVPVGWICGGDLDLGKRAMTETVTVTAMLPTLLPRDGLQMGLRDPVRLFTRTQEIGYEEVTINPELPEIEPALSAAWAPMGPSERGADDHEYITYPGHIPHGPSSAEITPTSPSPPAYTSEDDSPTPDTTDYETFLHCPAVKPILEVSCVDRTRLMWNDFKITWGPAWNDQSGCRRLYREMDKRGLVTGFHCSQIADQESNTWLMEARGHRPRFPRTLVADAIRAAFSDANTLYYRGYDTKLLCDKFDGWWY